VRTSIETTVGGAGAASFLAKAKAGDKIISKSPSIHDKLNAILVMCLSFTRSAAFPLAFGHAPVNVFPSICAKPARGP